MLKLAFISLLVFFIVFTCISLFFPSHLRLSKAINIHTAPDSVWSEIDDLSRWRQWNPFFANLDTAKIEYLDTSKGRWNAVKVATTTVRWKEMKAGEHIAEMQNGDRSPVFSGWKCMKLSADSVTVQWYMDFHLRWYPWEKFGSLLYEGKYGSQMEKGLSNLRSLLQK